MSREEGYMSYLLRLWQDGSGEAPLWRASLESPHSDELQGFAGLDELFTFLREQISVAPPPGAIEQAQRNAETEKECKEN